MIEVNDRQVVGDSDSAVVVPEIPIILLIIFSALTYGGVTAFSIATIQAVIALTVAWWLLAMIGGARLRFYRTPLDSPALGFLAVATLSLLWSIYPYATRIQLYRLYAYVAVFYLLINTLRGRRRPLCLARWIVGWGTVYALVGLFRLESLFERVSYFAPIAEQNVEQGLRLTFVNHSNYAAYLSMICCLALGLALAERGLQRLLLLFFAAVIALAVCTSLSRGGMLGLFAGFCFLFAGACCDRKQRQAVIWLGSFGIAVVLSLNFLVSSSPVFERLETLRKPLDAGELRLAMWHESLKVIAERPWLGSGLGTYLYASPRHQSERTARWVIDHPHNEYLERTAELGLVGTALAMMWLAVLFGGCSRRLWREKDRKLRCLGVSALAGCFALLMQDVVDFQLSVPSNALLFTVCAALAVICATREQPAWVERCLAKKLCVSIAVSVIGLTGIALLASSKIYIGDGHAREARELSDGQFFDLASAELGEAIKAEPANARHLGQIGLLFRARVSSSKDGDQRTRYRRIALEAFDRAIQRCPYDGFYHSQRAQLLLELGRHEEALPAFETAILRSPMRAHHHYHLARFLLETGDAARAHAEYQRAIELEPGYLGPALRQLWNKNPDDSRIRHAVPRIASVRQVFARFLSEKGHHEAAARELGQAAVLTLTSEHASRHLEALLALDDLSKARYFYRSYRERLPDSASLRNLGARILVADGKHRQAASDLGGYLERGALDIRSFRLFLEIHREMKDVDGALAVSRRLFESAPLEVALYLELASFLEKARRTRQAVDVLQQGIDRLGSEPELLHALYRPLRSLGRHSEALESLKRATALAPRTSSYSQDLDRFYEEMKLSREMFGER